MKKKAYLFNEDGFNSLAQYLIDKNFVELSDELNDLVWNNPTESTALEIFYKKYKNDKRFNWNKILIPTEDDGTKRSEEALDTYYKEFKKWLKNKE